MKHITFLSYPRSGRHRFAASLAALQSWTWRGDTVKPVAVNVFLDMPDAPGYGVKDNLISPPKEGYCYLFASHLPPYQVEGPKIIVRRNPREVAVSYAHWWARSTNRTPEQREEFLDDWVIRGPKYTKRKWNANIHGMGWEDWHATISDWDTCIDFADISPKRIQEALKRHGIETSQIGSPFSFADLQKSNPTMYRNGKSGAGEFPARLERYAELRNWPTV